VYKKWQYFLVEFHLLFFLVSDVYASSLHSRLHLIPTSKQFEPISAHLPAMYALTICLSLNLFGTIRCRVKTAKRVVKVLSPSV